MRTPTLLSIACALALGACGSHSLTGDQTGAGGAGTGGVGTGGFATGGSSAGGSNGTLQSFCSSLEDQYDRALDAAKACDVGTTASCAQQVNSSLRACDFCRTFVTDASKLNTLRQTYDQAGCPELLVEPCFDGACLPANNNVCVSIDGGSRGSCSYVPATTGTGGNSGDAGVGGCNDLAAEYSVALAAAKTCDAAAAGQCAQKVPASLSPCSSNCVEYVNDGSALASIEGRWQALGCGNVVVACPAIACVQPVAGLCTATDGGGARCAGAYPVGVTAP